MLNDVIKFKIHVQTGLESYEQFVDEEVSAEYEDLEREQRGLDEDEGAGEERREDGSDESTPADGMDVDG